MAAQAEELKSTYVPRSQTEQIKWLEQLDASVASYKERYTTSWPKSAAIYRGDNWDSRKEGNPFFKTNLARAKVDRKAARLTACKPIVGILPHRSGLTEAARILQRAVDALWDALDIQMRIEQMSTFVRPFGCGFFKTVWDPRARNGLGEIAVAEIDPRRIALDPYALRAFDIEKSLFIRHETSMPMSWVKANFPKHYREVDDFTAPPPSPSELEQRFSVNGPVRSPLRFFMGSQKSTGQPGSLMPIPYVRVRECWYADPLEIDDEAVYPNGRVTYLIGSGRKAVIVNPEREASKNPFFDGQYPFDMFDARPDIDHPWGSSQIEDIRRLEEALNRSGHMALRNLIKNIDVLISDAGALTPEYLKKLSDAGWMVINKMRGLDVTPNRAVNAIQDSIALINTVMQLMDIQIGLGGDNPVSGRGRVEVRSPDLLYGLQQDNDLINVEARRLESFLERVVAKMVSRIFQFYRADRFIPYVTATGLKAFQFEVKQLRAEINQIALDSVSARLIDDQQGNDDERAKKKVVNFDLVRTAVEAALRGAWKEFDVKIVPLSSLATTRMARAKMMGEFVQQGAMPMSMVLAEAGFPNHEDLQKEAIEEKVTIGQMYQVAGLEPPQPPGGAQKKQSQKK